MVDYNLKRSRPLQAEFLFLDLEAQYYCHPMLPRNFDQMLFLFLDLEEQGTKEK